MSKKLTDEQIEARIAMYQEAIDHLNLSVCDNKEEEKQAVFVRREIMHLLKAFIKKHKP